MDYTINNKNLKSEEITDFSSKARAILLNDDNQILIVNYGGNYLLPGGSVDNKENIIEAIKRELLEELGQSYNENELEFIGTIHHFQNDYPKRNGTIVNRMVKTSIFTGKLKSTNFENKKLTSKEEKDGFNIILVPLDNLKELILSNSCNNPRKKFFQEELILICDNMIKLKQQNKILIKKSSSK